MICRENIIRILQSAKLHNKQKLIYKTYRLIRHERVNYWGPEIFEFNIQFVSLKRLERK